MKKKMRDRVFEIVLKLEGGELLTPEEQVFWEQWYNQPWVQEYTRPNLKLAEQSRRRKSEYNQETFLARLKQEAERRQEVERRQEAERRRKAAGQKPWITRLLERIGLRVTDGVVILLVILGCTVLVLQYNTRSAPSGPLVQKTVQTPSAQQASYVLPDSTHISLYALSTVRFPESFPGSARKVELVKGKAYFAVSPNKEQPFIVTTSRYSIQVLGTRFVAENYADEPASYVTLLEGQVNIVTPFGQAALRPLQQARITADRIEIFPVKDSSTITNWRNGYFSCDSMSMTELGREIGSWYGKEVIIAPEVQHIRPTLGRIDRDEPISYILEVLKAFNEIRYRQEGNRVFIDKK